MNALTVDVEDYHNLVDRQWLGRETPPTAAVDGSTRRLLNLFDQHGVSATFFVLGEVAREFPRLIREINERGHEFGRAWVLPSLPTDAHGG